MLTMKLRN